MLAVSCWIVICVVISVVMSEDRPDAIAKRTTHRFSDPWRHPGVAVFLVLPGAGAEPRPAQRSGAAVRGVRRESVKKCRARHGARYTPGSAAHGATIRQPGTSRRAGRL